MIKEFLVFLCADIALFLAIGLQGCASEIRTPCEFDVHVKVGTTAAVDSECKEWNIAASDFGNRITRNSWLLGCASSGEKNRIVTIADREVYGHELNHQVEANCAIEKEK